jgi:hypothetical protein
VALGAFSLQFAQITAVDSDKKTVSAQSRFDGSVITNIAIEPSLHQQYLPTIGQQVILLRSDYFTVVLAYLGTRKFDAPIKAGEIKVEGSGGGFFYANRSGDVEIADADLSNVHKLIASVGWQFVGNALSLVVTGIGQINIKEGQIEIVKTTGQANIPTTKIVLTTDKVVVKAPTVELGVAAIAAGVVTTSGVPGPYSFDWMGKPIPGSATIKESL